MDVLLYIFMWILYQQNIAYLLKGTVWRLQISGAAYLCLFNTFDYSGQDDPSFYTSRREQDVPLLYGYFYFIIIFFRFVFFFLKLQSEVLGLFPHILMRRVISITAQSNQAPKAILQVPTCDWSQAAPNIRKNHKCLKDTWRPKSERIMQKTNISKPLI